MADIGRSTQAHVSQHTQTQRNIERLLVNWGNFLASQPAPMGSEIAASPTFREYVCGYRDTNHVSRIAENIDVALTLDEVIATLPERYVCCLHCHYVLELSTRGAAKLMSMVERQDHGTRRDSNATLKCTHPTYGAWLDAAIDAVESRIDLYVGLDLDSCGRMRAIA